MKACEKSETETSHKPCASARRDKLRWAHLKLHAYKTSQKADKEVGRMKHEAKAVARKRKRHEKNQNNSKNSKKFREIYFFENKKTSKSKKRRKILKQSTFSK